MGRWTKKVKASKRHKLPVIESTSPRLQCVCSHWARCWEYKEQLWSLAHWGCISLGTQTTTTTTKPTHKTNGDKCSSKENEQGIEIEKNQGRKRYLLCLMTVGRYHLGWNWKYKKETRMLRVDWPLFQAEQLIHVRIFTWQKFGLSWKMKDNSYSRDVESKERMNKRQQQRLAKIYIPW